MKDIEHKRAAVMQHYSKAYQTEFKRPLTHDEINLLYDKMQQLRYDEAAHYERRPTLKLLVDNTCQQA